MSLHVHFSQGEQGHTLPRLNRDSEPYLGFEFVEVSGELERDTNRL
jgi:hypothetical protein